MSQISKEYAQALYILAKEKSKESEYEKDLTVVENAVLENPEYLDFLSSPQVSIKERLKALDEAFGAVVCEHILSFLKLLCERGLIKELSDCAKEYKKLLEFSKHISTACVKSAVSFSNEEKERLKEKLEKMSGHTVLVEYSIDESLIGGAIVEIDGKIIDGSIKSRLHDVKEVISR